MEIAIKRQWTKRDIRKALTINFIILLLLFAALYYMRTSPTSFISTPSATKAPSFLFNIYGPLGNGFKKPMDVTVINDRIYVSDSMNCRVVVFDYDGKYLFNFGKPGYGKSEFNFVYGLASDSKGDLYVADMKNGGIMIFDGNGKFKQQFAEKAASEKIIDAPAGICIQDNKVYVADLGQDAVLVFDLQGKLLQKIGKSGKGDGELRAPNGVTVKGNKVYVSDSANDRVVVFDDKGKFQGYVGMKKDGSSTFVNPRGLSFNGDVLIVANNISSHAHAFDITKKDKEVYSFGQIGPEDGNFGLPNGLFVDDRGRVYITDTQNDRVVVFQN